MAFSPLVRGTHLSVSEVPPQEENRMNREKLHGIDYTATVKTRSINRNLLCEVKASLMHLRVGVE